MKTLALAAALALAAFTSPQTADACDGHGKKTEQAQAKKSEAPKKLASVAFKVDGMHCGGCGDKIRGALAKVDGVWKVDVKQADGRVMVEFDSSKTNAAAIAKAIGELGYKATTEA